jgi:hypothetical protein
VEPRQTEHPLHVLIIHRRMPRKAMPRTWRARGFASAKRLTVTMEWRRRSR